MNGYLKYNTASQVRTIGPFVSDSDFKTLATGLTVANTDLKIKKNGGAAASKNSGGATADSTTGLYHLTWDATDTNTVGELSVSVKVSGALVYFCTYTVLTAAVYDMLFGASATGFISDTTRASQTSVDAIGAAVDTEVAAILAAVDTEVAAIKSKTDNLPSDPADASDIAASFTTVNTKLDTITSGLPLDASELTAIAQEILKVDWTTVSGEAAYSVLNALRQLRNVWDTTGSTLHVYKENGTTLAWQRALTVDAAAAPIIGAE